MIKSSACSTATPENKSSRVTTLKFFVGIAAVCFILRIFYAGGNLYQDDGLWFAAAEEVLRGKALYSEIFFDKPPILPLLYAGLFKLFGRHIITIRLFAICSAMTVSYILYRFGSRLYEKRTALIAAAMFSVFSTTYVSGDMQSLNTDFLMTPFYAAGAYLLIRSGAGFIHSREARDRRAWLAFAGGCMVGLAFQINAKGVFDLLFFALFLIAAIGWRVKELQSKRRGGAAISSAGTGREIKSIRVASRLFVWALAGFTLASLPFFLHITATHSLSHYKLYVWDMSLSYTGYYSAWRAGEIFLRHGTDYFLINNTLLITLVVVVAATLRQAWRYTLEPQQRDPDSNQTGLKSELTAFKSDATLLLWFAVSFVGAAAGGRFFAHYYFQVLPSLCLIGARGLVLINSSLKARNMLLRAVAITGLVIGFAYTMARSHSETVGLALDWARDNKSQLNREARIVAAMVRDLPDPVNTVDRVGAESIREGGPRTRDAVGPSDYLFVWGNWPEVYYWSGLLPASRYLGVQPLTGLPADIQYGKEEYRSLLDTSLIAAARAELVRDLEQTPPKYVVDELGFRDRLLSIERYPELQDFMSNYERYKSDGTIPIYIRKSIKHSTDR